MVTTLTNSPTVSVPSPTTILQERAPRPPARSIQTRGAPIAILGVPFDNVTTAETIALIDQMVASRRAHYLATANVDFLVQAVRDVELRRILFEAHLVLCDGTPLLWASRLLGNPLPERVAGSDMVPVLMRAAAEKGYRVFFLGGSPESTTQAVTKLQLQYPDLVIAGHYSPPFQQLLEMDHGEIRRRILAAKPDILLVAFGCPKQEKWIAMHYRSLGVPVCIGVGGTIDFLAGRLQRAPLWMQRTGTEWVFRLMQEPRRLFKRYATDCWYFGRLIAGQWLRTRWGGRPRDMRVSHGVVRQCQSWHEIQAPESLDAQTVRQNAAFWDQALARNSHFLMNLSQVQFLDSTGVGLLIRLKKQATVQGAHFVLVAPSAPVTRTLRAMQLLPFFLSAANAEEASALLKEISSTPATRLHRVGEDAVPSLVWQGEVTAANADAVWQPTEDYLTANAAASARLTIDLGKVTFIDSTGVGLMVRAKKRAVQAGASLRFTEPQPLVRQVICLSKLEAYLLAPV